MDEGEEQGATEPSTEPVEAGQQVPLARDRWDYIAHPTPQMVVGADGMPVLAPGEPPAPEPGLSRASFVCSYDPGDGNGIPERPVCTHYGVVVMPSTGVTRGLRQRPREIRRFCRALASGKELFELTDNDVLACSLRHPMDPESEAKILEVEHEQRSRAAESARRSGNFEI